MVKLADLFEKPITGEWGTEANNNEGFNVIRTTNFTNIGKLDLKKGIAKRELDFGVVERKKLRPGDIIIEKSGGSDNQLVGRVVYFDLDDDIYLCNNFTAILRPRKEYFPKFILYYMLYLYHRGKVSKFQNKTTGIINLKLNDYLDKVLVEVPKFEIQRRIAAVLDKAQELIDKRKQQIEKLDEFLQSVFLDMFGDPVKNPKGWEKKKLGYVSHIQGGLQVTTKRADNPIELPYLRVANVYRDLIDLKEIKTIKVTEGEAKRVALIKGDILIVEGHGNPIEIGRSAVWEGSIQICLHQNHLIRVRVDTDYAVPVFISYYINSAGGRQQMFKAGKTTSGLNTISSKNVKETLVLLPPLPLQKQFGAIVEKVKSLKAKYTDSLTEMENLFNSLMGRAFSGKLVPAR